MIAVLFKFPAIGYVGVAFGKSQEDLFWLIDEHGDPFSCLIKKVNKGSLCYKNGRKSGIEPSEQMGFDLCDKDGWTQAEWEGYPWPKGDK